MALYIDSAYLDDITAVAQTLPVAGVTTNPTLLLNAYQNGQRTSANELVAQLLKRTRGTVFMQPTMVNEEAAYREAHSYIEADPERVIPKIPMNRAGVRVGQRLYAEGHHIAFTAITTVSQAYVASLVGAKYIIPYYNRLRRSGVDPCERIGHMARVIAGQTPGTRILAASIKSTAEASEALLSGAHDLTIPPAILLEMANDPESEEAIMRFEQDLKKMKNL
ncbi:transaldolase family protein [Dictyobacter formicarum]|uniref:Fructose-6-phosphate aldolase n=1 Tax=Dictyobacter formicarum TaxID=2778368 RepID=A0ABQ3VKH8_9CHLR|nr:transaldolase family protein [Dictyobacter formicarum]GHO85621.1 fructose-6-phosphate aldolase [Dictyobacter formicarum]